MKDEDYVEHPENFPSSPTDRYNRVRPEPRSFDELAAGPDPVAVKERNRASTRQAIFYAAGVVIATFAVAFVLALISRLQGGPLCDAGQATWLCTQSWRTWWALGSSIVPIVGLLGCAVIMVRKLNRYERWVPWMGVFWLPIVPFTMWWLTVTVGIIALDSV
ncbi:hypothetical protein M3D57_07460 [Corynebacterium sanguinis]|uniref:Uncharacterized protein n=1 Tax=Corynebacterium sanguinis TaxID=2594913 RepID=A0A838WU17_9CORY|nr:MULTISPECIES: hypothetical protein [Corynebacterium]MBA4504255.1 hypothetical protein [Corynebacterium sanguinis]MCT1414328.1 hypothetical protein [Corynebacterium sanguinis]MCT1585012.1 hypothetical protein [Corynebacterium sanguinis]MCT1695703.1 hypothetical protein [Corynebacterium sanguinis]MCT1715111.1 hypothetical protein [Corynebacterium sanguinis]